MKLVHSNQAPAAIGPYSQGIDTGSLVFLSGQLPVDAQSGELAARDIAGQTRQAILNMRQVLQSAGLTLADVVKTTVFLQDMDDFAQMNAVYAEFFSQPYPARSAVEVAALPKGARVEIEAVAGRGNHE